MLVNFIGAHDGLIKIQRSVNLGLSTHHEHVLMPSKNSNEHYDFIEDHPRHALLFHY